MILQPPSRSSSLDAALDSKILLDLIGRSLRDLGHDAELEDLGVMDVRYRPADTSWILYRVTGRRADGEAIKTFLTGQLLRDGDQPAPLPLQMAERYTALDPEPALPPILEISSLPMLLYSFPVDTALPGLFDATSPTAMKGHFENLWSTQGLRVLSVRVQQLGYTPQSRAAFDYEVLSERKDTRVPEVRRLIGKMHAKKAPHRLFGDSWLVWRAGGKRLGLAPPAGYLNSVGITFQERVPGIRLGGLVERSDFGRLVVRTARALAHLHRLSVPISGRRKVADEVRGIERWAGTIARVSPDLANRVGRLKDRLTSEVAARMETSGPIHADFHHTNVLVDKARVTIIDLDEMAYGDPAVDVGRFMASLRVPARRAFGDPHALDGARDSFLGEYLRCRGGDGKRARLFEAAFLLTSAGSAFRIQRAGWEEEVSQLLAESERVLDLATKGSPLPAPAPEGRPSLSEKERTRWARDGTYMRASLDPAVIEAYGAELERCKVQKGSGSSGERRVQYELRGRKGPDPWSLKVGGTLRDSGGKSLIKRIERLNECLAHVPEAPVLPRPITYLRTLGLLVSESPEGEKLSEGFPGSLNAEILAQVGRGVAVLHQAPVALERRRSLEQELRRLRRRVEALGADDPGPGGEADRILRLVIDRVGPWGSLLRPSVGLLYPHHLFLSEGRVLLGKVDDVILSNPALNLADLLARLLKLGIRRGMLAEAQRAVARIEAGYRKRSSGDPDLLHVLGEEPLSLFKALALVRMACSPKSVESDLRRAFLKLAASLVDADVSSDADPQRKLIREVAKLCRGRTVVIGSDKAVVVTGLAGSGLDVFEGDSLTSPREAKTIVLADDLGKRSEDEALQLIEELWGGLRSRGRLIVVVPNAEASRGGDGAVGLPRRAVKALLRPHGRLELSTGQPYRWLVMSLLKKDRGGTEPRDNLLREERFRATANLCLGKVLELGCGEGHLAKVIADRGLEVVGIDISRRKVRAASNLYPGIVFKTADIRDVGPSDLPHPEFETVVLAEVLEHVPESVGEAILAKAWGLLAPGGRLVVSVPNENSIPHPNHITQYDRKRLAGLLRVFGKPVLVTEQPYKWLMMYVEQRG